MRSRQPSRFAGSMPASEPEVTSIAAKLRDQLWARMARECVAMAEHALSTGRPIPPEVLERLDEALSTSDVPAPASVFGPQSIGDRAGEAVVGSESTAVVSRLASLSLAHSVLTQVVAPATPESILQTAEEREP